MQSNAQLDADVVVIGAGVVGLACAASLARAGRSVLVLERNDGIAQEVTARNSEVIHAGLYYPSDSLKAELCREGRQALYARCRERGIGHRRVGKLVVATQDSERATLERLFALGNANGAPGLELLDAVELKRLEPQVVAPAALHSPDTGIVDAQALSLSFLAEAESHGAQLVLQCEVVTCKLESGGLWRLDARGGGGEEQGLRCLGVVNAAGLAGDAVAALAGLDVDDCGYRIHPCKGDYFSLAPGVDLDLSHLVYPVPGQAGLGIHSTIDLGGRIRFGPDAEYVDSLDYAVSQQKASEFERALRRFLPTLPEGSLVPDFAGIRPKLAGPGQAFRDFVVQEESARGRPGWVSCIGIESPGLTAAPAIAERVASLLQSL